jgi:hypothetical protein
VQTGLLWLWSKKKSIANKAAGTTEHTQVALEL